MTTPIRATQPPAVAQVARVHKILNQQRARVPQVSTLRPGKTGFLVQQPANAARLAAILHNAAMDLWDVATEEDPAQMWEEARAIASRILAACPAS